MFVDESGVATNLVRLYGRAPKGERAVGQAPYGRWEQLTIFGGLSLGLGLGACMSVEGAADTLAVVAFVEHVLVPTLRRGQVVVLDNLSAHKATRLRERISGAGCELWYLPSYSPDLSPIEEAFSKLKTLLRRAAARTKEALLDAIGSALSEITSSDARGYFTHCGFLLPQAKDH